MTEEKFEGVEVSAALTKAGPWDCVYSLYLEDVFPPWIYIYIKCVYLGLIIVIEPAATLRY